MELNAGYNKGLCIFGNDRIREKWLYLRRYYSMNISVYEMETHAHDEIEIMYVVYGECEITCIGQEGECRRKLRKEEYVLVDAGVRHSLYIERGVNCKILNLEFLLQDAGRDFRVEGLTRHSASMQRLLAGRWEYLFLQDKSWLKDHNGEMFWLIDRIQYYDKSPTDQMEGRIAQNHYIAQFLIALSRQTVMCQEGISGNRYVKRVREYLENNYENHITVSEIGEKLCISESYLQRLYKQSEGESIIQALNRLRIEKACVLLRDSKLPVIDIAVAVGFHSRQHFSHIFTRECGCSPARYRKIKGNAERMEGHF